MKKNYILVLMTLAAFFCNPLQAQELHVFSNGSLYISPKSNIHVDNNIEVANDGDFTISSDAANSGSLIVTGAATGAISYQRQIPNTNWHFVAAPVTAQDIQSFVLDAANGIPTSATNNYGISVYNNEKAEGSRWDYYNTSASGQDLSITDAGNFINGAGYSMLRNATGLYTFKGNMAVTDVAVSLRTVNNHKWNLIGNPYPSFLPANSAANSTNILSLNIDELEEDFAYLQLWTGAKYEIINLASPSALYLAPGQAFFVDPKNDNVTFVFPESQQTAQVVASATLLKRAPTPEITVRLAGIGLIKTTRLKYLSNTNTGLDIGYDAGTYTDATPTFAIDTHLVSDSKGVNFTLQCLPNTGIETFIIPLAITVAANKSITFNAIASNFPENINVFLEDTAANTVTNISTTSYQLTTDHNLNGIGRFYLYTAENVLSTEDVRFSQNLSIYKTSNTNVRIANMRAKGVAVLKMYSVLGQELLIRAFKMKPENDIALPDNLAAGMYLIQVITNGTKQTKKLFIE